MPERHTLKSGECLQSLAYSNGLRDGNAIFEFGDNADLRGKRRGPADVTKGDTVGVPDPRPKNADRATDAVHLFRLATPQAMLRIEVHDDFGEPIGSKPYALHLNDTILQGTTTDAGLIEQPVPFDVPDATLVVYATANKQEGHWCWQVRIADLDPPETAAGSWERLCNLGYWNSLEPPADLDGADAGASDEMSRDPLVLAIRGFQHDEKLKITGRFDDATRAKLVERHGI
ncbi:MAG TPA: peptidoglycan-binding domain-containing protein [Steroidobacteraceae bacterium]|nr:peptidoglycan-binding domain-containing protein [Steroidobacteraceae bacterium]